MQKEAFEPTGLIPRSIIRTFDRFLQQLLPGSESVAIQEYRVSRYQILVSIQSLFVLVCIPFFVNYAVKCFVLTPLTEHFWNFEQKEIFLNAYQEKRAFAEMQDFSEKIFFESLLRDNQPDHQLDRMQLEVSSPGHPIGRLLDITKSQNPKIRVSHAHLKVTPLGVRGVSKASDQRTPKGEVGISSQIKTDSTWSPDKSWSSEQVYLLAESAKNDENQEEYNLQKQFQLKSLQIASRYNQQSILAITNTCADFIGVCTLYLLSVFMKPQIIILKSFLIESIYSLSDTTKSFLLILGMDLLVGFHSPRGWEIALETLLRHFGLPENENFILLFVALFPVFLDTVFKYWIFRYLNKISPSTVVTYHSMLE
uniref:chloroplast enveloppe membrane protein n=1 Tax=Phyllosiphon coccidium TaxID=1837062 RepID=UPI0024118439|nr:chloroplast enveloppe membrane protein [Phyllosiphon coccidium]WDY12737.1 chloroplast enveloppe membrane protein [Phyllosiphon coccidium]